MPTTGSYAAFALWEQRAAAELKQPWRALKYITLSPGRIGAITKDALVLNNAWK